MRICIVFFYVISTFVSFWQLNCASVAPDSDLEQGQEEPIAQDKSFDFDSFFDNSSKILNLSNNNFTDENLSIICKNLGEYINANGVKTLLMENNKLTTIPSELVCLLVRSNSLGRISFKGNIEIVQKEAASLLTAFNGFSSVVKVDDLEINKANAIPDSYKQIDIDNGISLMLASEAKNAAPKGRNYGRMLLRLGAIFLVTLVGHGVQLAGFYFLKKYEEDGKCVFSVNGTGF